MRIAKVIYAPLDARDDSVNRALYTRDFAEDISVMPIYTRDFAEDISVMPIVLYRPSGRDCKSLKSLGAIEIAVRQNRCLWLL